MKNLFKHQSQKIKFLPVSLWELFVIPFIGCILIILFYYLLFLVIKKVRHDTEKTSKSNTNEREKSKNKEFHIVIFKVLGDPLRPWLFCISLNFT